MRRTELEFLPAALEVQDSPPSPLGRAIVWTLIALVVGAIAWACVGKVDIVVTAQGKVIPSQRVKTIQPLEIGVVKAIHVRDGQRVTAGEPLLELDPTQASADATRLQREREEVELELLRLQALFAEALPRDQPPTLRFPAGTDANLAALQRNALNSEWQAQRAKLAALAQDIAGKRAEHAAMAAQVAKLTETLPLITRRAENFKTLTAKQLAPEQQYLELEQQRIETSQDLEASRHSLTQIEAALEGLSKQRDALQADFARDLAERRLNAQRRLTAIEQELTKSDQRQRLQQLTAPVDGVVQQLAAHTIGGVVTPAQPLMVIVPVEDTLEVEAFIENKDIGFVRAEQTAAVKVEAFPFTKYGTLTGTLRHISFDAIADEQRGLLFATRVALEKTALQVEDKLIPLTPGMAVTVEVKTGTRRLIEYFLSPLLQHVDESVRER